MAALAAAPDRSDMRNADSVRFVAEASRGLGRHEGGTAPTCFQDSRWLAAWYEAMRLRPDVEPLVVTVRDGEGRLAAILPFVRVSEGGRRVVTFADLELTDYNAAILGPAAPSEAGGAARLWRAVRRALGPTDLIRLRKMPPMVAGRPNPLALLPGVTPCAANGNVIETGDDYDAWRHTLVRHTRMDLERSWRVFQRESDARFRRIVDPAEGHRVLDAMEEQQAARMEALRSDYRLDEPEARAFYRGLIDRGIGDGFVVLTVLEVGAEIVGGCLGLHQSGVVTIIRLTNAGGRWSNCSPGRLVLERTMHMLHAEGCRTFDFSIGNQDYKRRFGIAPTPLVDLVQATGWRGVAASARAAVAGRLRSHPRLEAVARRWLARAAG